MSATGFQPLPSANAPWTSTTRAREPRHGKAAVALHCAVIATIQDTGSVRGIDRSQLMRPQKLAVAQLSSVTGGTRVGP